jgi:hypothetical protein
MRAGIQTLFGEAGEAACYAFDIIEIAERVSGKALDPVDAFYQGADRGYIHYDAQNSNDNDNFYVNDPAAFLGLLTGRKWTVAKTTPIKDGWQYENGKPYVPLPGDFLVDRWERVRTGAIVAHFRLPDWDSLVNSQTVQFGRIASRRVFREVP